MKKIAEQIVSIYAQAGFNIQSDHFVLPKIKGQGDISLPCFELAKKEGKSPVEVAKSIAFAVEIVEHSIIERIEAVGPYVNFYLKSSEVAQLILSDIQTQGDVYGHGRIGEHHSVLIEYPSQNTHKEFHIGHLRNVCIGNTLVQLFRASGYQVIPVNYINDFGAHVSKCLWGIINLYGGVVPTENVQQWLGEVYAVTSQYVTEHEEVKTQLQDILLKLEARDESIWALFETTRDASLRGFELIMRELGVEHTRVFLESEVKERGQAVVDEMIQKGIATVGEGGAIIADLSAYNLDIALLRKSTGAGLYMTSDLALAEKKFSEFQVSESINITGIEQNFYFQQLFKVLSLSGFSHKMTHIGYGLVQRSDGKMSSRLGNVILYSDLRANILERMMQEVGSRHTDWSVDEIASVASVLSDATLKFTMQSHEAIKNITFDIDEAVSFDGYSAPYILYSVARINSILNKDQGAGNSDQVDFECLNTEADKELCLMLAQYPAVIEKALSQYNPSVIAKYCFDVAQQFSSYYATNQIIGSGEGVEQARMALLAATKRVLVQALGLLTIGTVDKM
jgi:arginyl-tRNA synthetase